MKRILIAGLMLLAACRNETAALPDPVPMTAESVGYFCQMNVLEHPGPKGQAHLDGQAGKPLFFSQVRDTIAYMRMPEQSHPILAVYVSDMGRAASWDQPGADNWVLIDKASLVVGSDATGGMGAAEIVPFSDPARAQTFAAEHGGTVMRLADIPDSIIFADGVSPAPGAGTGTTADPDYQNRLRNLSQKLGG